MLCVRKGVFETNSSSVHTLCIPKEWKPERIPPKDIVIWREEYGWGPEMFSGPAVRPYLNIYLDHLREYNFELYEKYMKRLEEIQRDYGFKIEFEPPKDAGPGFNGYIDHADECGPLFETLMDPENEEMMLHFLFDPNVLLYCTNDNETDRYEELGGLPSDIEYDLLFK